MKGRWFLFLFALPFFGVGVWMTYSIGSTINSARQMKQWQPVDARILDAGYETHSGDDSDTYEVYAQYEYTINDRTYNATRVGISDGADNIGSYQTSMAASLQSAMQRGDSIVVYVDPDNPNNAVVDRSIRWGMLGFKSIFVFAFGGVGLGLILFVVFGKRKSERPPAVISASPWLDNDDWQNNAIKSNSRGAMYATWGFAVLWNLISAPLPFVIYDEIVGKGNHLALIGLLFPVVGAGLFYWAFKQTLEWRRFGRTPLLMDPFPGSIGGHTGGTIDIGLSFDPAYRYSLTLTNVHSYMSGSGDDRSRRESAKWQDSQVAHASSHNGGTRLVFRFDVPEDLSESDANPSDDSYYLWRLSLQADLPGTDVDRSYEIPVYPTGQTSNELPEFSIQRAHADQAAIDDQSIRSLVQIGSGEYGRTVSYPAGRNKLSGFIGTVFGAVFGGVGIMLIVKDMGLFIGSAFTFAGALVLIISFYSVFNSLEIYQERGVLRTVRRVLGITVKQQQMPRADFREFSQSSSMQSQSGGKHVMHYKVFAVNQFGRKMVVGEGLKGASEARAASRLISREFGLREKHERSMESAGTNYLSSGA